MTNEKARYFGIIILSLIFILTAFFVGRAFYSKENLTTFAIFSAPKHENAGISVYFCRDENISCEQKFIDVINSADKFVYCAFYNLNLDELTNEINKKNITIKIVIDKRNYKKLNQTVKKSTNSALMHNKFCVTDKEIITGSFNPTKDQESYDDNNIVVSNSSYLMKNYETEFYELYDDIKRNTPNTLIELNDKTLIENYFCPEENCEEHVLLTLNKANKSIKFMTFSFTSEAIGNKLVEKNRNNVEIKGVFEKSQSIEHSQMEKLEKAGCNVTYDKNRKLMHHKIFIIDDKIVITGSYNPTANGNQNNDENIIIIHDKDIAAQYNKEFERIVNK
ncbi:MAG: phospholipase D-like domain-containing protein [Candidatus Woesearchaeota archaeon]